MPYIKNKNDRKKLDKLVRLFIRQLYFFTGNLNYFLFRLASESCHCYADYQSFIGELEAAKLEIYRRQVAPYEDKKIEENGDVE